MPVKGCQVSGQDRAGRSTEGAGHITFQAGLVTCPADLCAGQALTAVMPAWVMGWWKQESEQWSEILKIPLPGERNVLSVILVWLCRQAEGTTTPASPQHSQKGQGLPQGMRK